jgi:hypothetical protein
MITLEIIDYWGEVDSVVHNFLEVDGVGGLIHLTIDSIDEGEGFTPIVTRSIPNVIPRISVARETKTIKVGG